MSKQRVIVVYGGNSTEHEVSCRSAAFLLRNIDPKKYDIHAIAVTKQGRWLPQNTAGLLSEAPNQLPVSQEKPEINHQEAFQGSGPVVVFPMIHGTGGEDGSLQGMLDLSHVAYVGADTLGSSVAMDKVVAKQLVAAAGVPVVPGVDIRFEDWVAGDRSKLFETIKSRLGEAVFVKPAALGSSVGITRVRNLDSLAEACDHAFTFDDRILIEKAMNVRELECALLGGYDPEASEIGEVAMNTDQFYDYKSKYQDESAASIVIPANIPDAIRDKIKNEAITAFKALNLYGMARIDFFLEKGTEQVFFNEANTIPGFTSISQYPLLWKASGVSHQELLDRLIQLAIKRYERKASLKRSL